MTDDARWMRVALALGRRGLGHCWPNPSVGCVIVSPNGRVVGRGWTQPGGRPHAETVALQAAGDRARGATAYVSLEPCAHHGATGPCAEALVAAGVARVVTALEDPDPRVDGGGHARLRAAGVDVVTDVEAAAARRDHAGFLKRVTDGRPLVTLKLASTLDGRIATQTGESQWITGPEARRLGHALRARHDAVLVGAGTVRADDPTLTVRGLGIDRQPVRVVLSHGLDVPNPSNLSSSANRSAPVWFYHAQTEAARTSAARFRGSDGLETIELAPLPDEVLVDALLADLAARGITRVYCEGGGQLAASLLEAGCVDRLVVFTAGCLIGAEGRPALGDLGLTALAQAPRFRRDAVQSIGADTVSYWSRQSQD